MKYRPMLATAMYASPLAVAQTNLDPIFIEFASHMIKKKTSDDRILIQLKSH